MIAAADVCRHTPLWGGRRGVSVERVSYQLAVNGDEHLLRAQFDVATWAERVHQRSRALTAATSGPAE